MRRCLLFTHYGLTTVGIVLVLAHAAAAAGTPEQSCQKGRYAAAAKYLACEQRATGDQFGGGFSSFQGVVSKCRLKYAATWVRLQAQATGTGTTCDHSRFDINGDGTVTDRLTGIQWERKTDDLSVHDKDDIYTWSAGGSGFTAAGMF